MLQENQLFANRYRLVKRLGQGAFSEVWKAEDTKVGNLTVALKVYAPDKGLDEDGAKVFGDEFAIVFNIHHQNLLTPSSFDEENGSPYLVLPFCEQGSSLKLVGKMDERQAAKFMRDVSSALAYLHAKDIIHQDIKPDNVLIDGEDNYMVTDFGISTRIRSTLRRSVGDKKSAGTMAYMGPERFGRNPKPIKASDVWSLGATIYELMSGDVPYGDMGGGMQTAGAIVPELEGNYSAELKQLVEQCLAKEPWDRPTAVQLRDISEKYLRTGKWDLSPLDGGTKPSSEPLEPSRDDPPSKRPTQRKVQAEPIVDTPPQAAKPSEKVLPPIHVDYWPNPRKRMPWIIGGVAAVAILAVVLATVLHKGQKHYRNDDEYATTTTQMKDSSQYFMNEKAYALIKDTVMETLANTYTVNGVTFKMKYVRGGTFQMGNNDDITIDTIHEVTISDFCIGETEVTQKLWKAVMGSNLESQRKKSGWSDTYGVGPNYPMYYVNYYEMVEFCDKLNDKLAEQLPLNYQFALPTDAQWEFAARGGNASKGYLFSGSNTMEDVGWYAGNSGRKTHPVKSKSPNELGLYDMSGNVSEVCSDGYCPYRNHLSINPVGCEDSELRVCRDGGAMHANANDCQVSGRVGEFPDSRDYCMGFRLVITNTKVRHFELKSER